MRDSHRRSKGPNWLAISLISLLVIVPVVSCGGVFVVATISSRNRLKNMTPGEREAEEHRTARERERLAILTRGQFRDRVIGKTRNDVIEEVGKPDSTQVIGNLEFWYYHSRTRDTVTGNIDSQTQIVFNGGIAESVNH